MPQNVEITVKTQLAKIIKDLDGISASFKDVEDGMKTLASAVDDGVQNSFKKTQAGVSGVAAFMKRVFMGLRDDVKALTSVASLSAGLKLSNTMKGTITDTVTLTDAVRKLSGVFKIATGDQSRFVGDLMKGLGDIGLGSEAAANALQGLSETQVRGQGNLIGYARTAGQLAGAGNQRGREGAIAAGLAGVVQARGHNVNDLKEMQTVAEAVNRAHNVTGTPVTEILSSMHDLFMSMNDAFKQKLTPQAAASLTAISAAGGKPGGEFIRDYLSQNPQLRAGLDVLGFGKIFTEKGLNSEALRGIIGRGRQMGLGGNVEAGLTNMGLSPEQAKGLKMLFDQLEAVNRAAAEVATSTQTVAKSFEDAKTLGEAFRGNFDKVKQIFARPIAGGTNFLTDALKTTQKSNAASLAVVGGSAILAGFLSKVGLGGIGSAMGIKSVQERALEAKGEIVTPVRVVNFQDAPGALGGVTTAAGAVAAGAGVVGGLGVAAAGLGIAELVNEQVNPGQKNLIDGFTEALGRLLKGETIRDKPAQRVSVSVKMDDRNKELKTVHQSSRGPNGGGIK